MLRHERPVIATHAASPPPPSMSVPATSRSPAGPSPASDDGKHGRAVLRRDGVDAPVRPIAHVPGRYDSKVVRYGSLDDVEQFVPDVPMTRQLRASFDARDDRPSLRLRVLPETLHADSRLSLRATRGR